MRARSHAHSCPHPSTLPLTHTHAYPPTHSLTHTHTHTSFPGPGLSRWSCGWQRRSRRCCCSPTASAWELAAGAPAAGCILHAPARPPCAAGTRRHWCVCAHVCVHMCVCACKTQCTARVLQLPKHLPHTDSPYLQGGFKDGDAPLMFWLLLGSCAWWILP